MLLIMNWVISQIPYPKKQASMIRRKFTQEEDAKLCQLVNQYGAKKWDQIAKMMPGRTGRQCRDRYRNYLIPGFFNGQWSQEEDELLHEKFNQMGRQWARMMQFFPGRSANSLKNRWNYFVCRLDQEKKQNEDSTNLKNEANSEIPNDIKENENISNNEISNINASSDEKTINGSTNIEVSNENRINNEILNDNIPKNAVINDTSENNGSKNLVVQVNDQTNIEPDETIRPEPEERIIYGVNASTQTNESDLIEHERMMSSV